MYHNVNEYQAFLPLPSGLKPISVGIVNPSLKAGVNSESATEMFSFRNLSNNTFLEKMNVSAMLYVLFYGDW